MKFALASAGAPAWPTLHRHLLRGVPEILTRTGQSARDGRDTRARLSTRRTEPMGTGAHRTRQPDEGQTMRSQRDRYEAEARRYAAVARWVRAYWNGQPLPRMQRSPQSWLAHPTHAVIGLLAVAALVVVIISSWHAEGTATATAVCNGHNGDSAVAACHPDDQAVQDACPDNSNGQAYSAPTRTCLEAIP
jgi:hypothetical protein